MGAIWPYSASYDVQDLHIEFRVLVDYRLCTANYRLVSSADDPDIAG